MLAHYSDFDLGPLLRTQLMSGQDDYLYPLLRSSLSELSQQQLLILAEYKREEPGQLAVCFDELRRQLHEANVVPTTSIEHALVRCAALHRGYDVRNIVRVASRQSSETRNVQIVDIFCNQLRLVRDLTRFRALCEAQSGVALPDYPDQLFALGRVEQQTILRHAVLFSLEELVDLDDEIFASQNTNEPLSVIYALVSGKPLPDSVSVLFPDTAILDKRHRILYDERTSATDWYYRIFFSLLATYLSGNSSRSRLWLETIQFDSWPGQAVHQFAKIANDVAKLLRGNSQIGFGCFFAQLGLFKRPAWSEHQEVWRHVYAVQAAAMRIALDLLSISSRSGANVEVNQGDLELAFASGYCAPREWLSSYAERRRCLMSEQALQWLWNHVDELFITSVEPFYERADVYGQLATVATCHDHEGKAREFTFMVANLSITHGYHKDILVNEVLESVQICYHRLGRESPATKSAFAG